MQLGSATFHRISVEVIPVGCPQTLRPSAASTLQSHTHGWAVVIVFRLPARVSTHYVCVGFYILSRQEYANVRNVLGRVSLTKLPDTVWLQNSFTKKL